MAWPNLHDKHDTYFIIFIRTSLLSYYDNLLTIFKKFTFVYFQVVKEKQKW